MDLAYIKQNKKLMEKHRHINVDCMDWWDYTYDCFKDDMEEKGISVDRMFFSGFWSQGDGACFEGSIGDIGKFLDTNFKYTDYPIIRQLVKHNGTVTMKCEHRGHYYHENCTVFSMDSDSFYKLWQQPTEMHQHVVRALDEALGYELEVFEEDVVNIFRDNMKELYKRLEKEYEGLTSDESVAETILANDLYDDMEGE
jgi:hypothetical protein